MSTQSDQIDDALGQVQQAMIDASNAGQYTPSLQAKLDAVTEMLQTIENNLVLDTQQAILDALSGSNKELKQLNADISAFTTGLGKTATAIKKVSNTIGTVVTVVGAVVSGGII